MNSPLNGMADTTHLGNASVPVSPLLTLQGVSKRFGGVQALSDIHLEIEAGKVHAIIGENGAGKSTVGKVILGVHQADTGELRKNGNTIALKSPADAKALGFGGISQELSLLPTRSVEDNVSLGIEVTRAGFINRNATRKRVEEVMARYNMDLDLTANVGALPVVEQQKVETLRALARDADLLVFDEPTARLATDEIDQLLDLVKNLAAAGKAIIYVSHFLDEVLRVSDTITVLRNGHRVRSSARADETRETLIEGVTGRALEAQFPPKASQEEAAKTVLDVCSISKPGIFEDISLHVESGEIVGLAGLVGSGRSDVAMAIHGATPISAGEITLDGIALQGRRVAESIAAGIALIPESRRDQGLCMERSILENITLPHLGQFTRLGMLQGKAEARRVTEETSATGVKFGSLTDDITTLSGGNQQKCLFARATLGRPRLLIADEPTRGVDVGTRSEIYHLVRDQAQLGTAVIVVSSELPELLGWCDRITVMHEGNQIATFDAASTDEHELLEACYGRTR